MNNIKVCKFGGTSLATREQIEKCLDIMFADKTRKYMVVSAPGSRFKGDIKVTDLLIRAASEFKASGSSASAAEVVKRFQEIVPEDPALAQNLQKVLTERLQNTSAANYEEAVKAFGEFGSACAVASILKKKGIAAASFDPSEFRLVITGTGINALPDPKCYRRMGSFFKAHTKLEITVIPGFYGYDKDGNLQTLPRGGSDISGAVIARAVGASVYENWTDEDGLRRADPRVVENPATIPEIQYDEARELAYMGFKLQDACFEPIRGKGIVLQVRNTNNPAHPGTKIVDERKVDPSERIIGVACEKDFISIGMRKMYIDKEVGFGRKMFSVSEKLGLPYEHTLDGVDTTSMVYAKKYLKTDGAVEDLVGKLKKACKPDAVMIREFALLSVAGVGMKDHLDVHSRTFGALANAGVAIRMIDEGADDLSMFIGIDNSDAAKAVKAVYSEFF